jgi:hypothetical protein
MVKVAMIKIAMFWTAMIATIVPESVIGSRRKGRHEHRARGDGGQQELR